MQNFKMTWNRRAALLSIDSETKPTDCYADCKLAVSHRSDYSDTLEVILSTSTIAQL